MYVHCIFSTLKYGLISSEWIQVSREMVIEKRIGNYSSNHKMLLVGEGDFSFTMSLAEAFGTAVNITATSLDSHGTHSFCNIIVWIAFLYVEHTNTHTHTQALYSRLGLKLTVHPLIHIVLLFICDINCRVLAGELHRGRG